MIFVIMQAAILNNTDSYKARHSLRFRFAGRSGCLPVFKREKKMISINKNLELDKIDSDNEVCIEITGGYEESFVFINKEQAIKLIAHLQEQFGI